MHSVNPQQLEVTAVPDAFKLFHYGNPEMAAPPLDDTPPLNFEFVLDNKPQNALISTCHQCINSDCDTLFLGENLLSPAGECILSTY